MTPTCLDVSIYEAPIGSTGGFLQSLAEDKSGLIITDDGIIQTESSDRPTVTKYSIDKKCLAGTVYDSVFGECLYCEDMFGCRNCDESGCITCESGHTPLGGKCLVR